MDKKDYVIQVLTQQRDAANNEIARIISEANEQIDTLKARIAELEALVKMQPSLAVPFSHGVPAAAE
jgi:hypothetical protein